jgi:hypothetical protein
MGIRGSRMWALYHPDFPSSTGSGVPAVTSSTDIVSHLDIDTAGILSARYALPWSDQNFYLQSPDGYLWIVTLAGTTGVITVTRDVYGPAQTFYETDPDNVRWLISIDNDGILTASS